MEHKAAATMFIAIALAISTTACVREDQGKALPDVSEENCSPSRIAAIQPTEERNRFSDLCARRNTFKPSPKKGW